MPRITHQPGPGLVDPDAAQLRINVEDILRQQLPQAFLILQVARGNAAAPEQAVALDDAVIVRGPAVIAHGIGGTDRLGQAIAQVLGQHCIGRDGQEGAA